MNVRRFCVFTMAVLATGMAFSADEKDAVQNKKPRPPVQLVAVPNSQKGTFWIADGHKIVDAAPIIKEAKADFYKISRLNYVSTNGVAAKVDTARDLVKTLGANAAIFIVDETKLPPLLVAPEEHWAMVNVYALTRDGTEGDKLIKRVKGEVYRAFAIVGGCFISQFDGNVLDCTSLRELDRRDDDVFLPVDLYARLTTYLPKLGLEPLRRTTYRKACKEGWAHQPTNDIQRAIWEQVNLEKERGPVNAIKIAPPKK